MRERDRSSVVTELLDRSWGLFADDCLLYQPVKSDRQRQGQGQRYERDMREI